MSKSRAPRVIHPAAKEIAALIAREVRARCGADATFEQRRDVAAMVTQEVLASLATAGQKSEE